MGQPNALWETGILEPGGGRITGQGFVEEGAPGAGEEGSLATRDVFHEGHICVADTQELTVKGWIRQEYLESLKKK